MGDALRIKAIRLQALEYINLAEKRNQLQIRQTSRRGKEKESIQKRINLLNQKMDQIRIYIDKHLDSKNKASFLLKKE